MKYSIEEILTAMAAGKDISIKEHIEKTENYINPTAATLMLMAGFDEVTKYGTKISKAIGDYSGANDYLASLTTYNRNDFITGEPAKEVLNLIASKSEFMNRITWKTGDKLTYPVDIKVATEENLTSSLRAGAQPTTVSDKFGIVGKELFAQHCEFQINIKMLAIRNNLYNPNWEAELEDGIGTEISNDFLRLFTNGVEDDYSSVGAAGQGIPKNMYSLGIGWVYLLQTLYGNWTNSNVQSMVLGKFGDKVTPNKVEIVSPGTVTKANWTFASAEEGYTVDVGSSSTVSGAYLVTTLSADNGYVTNTGWVDFGKHAKGTLAFTYKISSGDVGTVKIVDAAGNTLVDCGALVETSDAEVSIDFVTRDSQYINVRIGAAANTDVMSTKLMTITKNITSYDGDDIIDIMDKLINVTPDQYRKPGTNVFVMSMTDAVKYSRAKGSPVQIIEGTAVGVNTEAREAWRIKGAIPPHEGYEVITNPMMFDINTSKVLGYNSITLHGSIIFGDPKELWAYGVGDIEKYREYKPRLSAGGSGYEIGEHFYIDAQIGNAESMAIAFYGAKCETPILMQTGAIKSTECVSSTTTAAAGFWAYCDTKDTRIFATLTSNVADIATLELAVAGVAAGDVFEVTPGVHEAAAVGQSFLTAAAWSFAAFKDGYLARSSVKACTFA